MVYGQLVVSVDFFKVLFGTLWSWFYLERKKNSLLNTAAKDNGEFLNLVINQNGFSLCY